MSDNTTPVASTRQSRSSSIPIPRSSSSTSTSRNIESVISIPFAGPGRPRLAAQPLSHRSIPAADRRGVGVAHGVRGSSSSLSNLSQTRVSPRSFTSSGVPPRPSPRSTTFEPRIIRADTARSVELSCPPSPSTSPSRARRVSTAAPKSNTQRLASGQSASTPTPPVSFPRPAYLEHSALRHLLQTESTSHLSPSRKAAGLGDTPTYSGSMSPSTDSDDDSNVSPPRAIPPAPAVPVHLKDYILRLPTRWSDEVRHHLLSVSADGRDLTYQGTSCNSDKDAAAARASHPIPPACGIYYYEVEIASKGQKGRISIGFAAPDVKLSRLPGWEPKSWGYHGDDGYSFAADRNGTPYGPTFGTGDVIGCGMDFSTNKAFFTKNGTLIGPVFDNIGKEGELFPSVGLWHSGESIRVNFGHEPFQYDIEYHVQQHRNQTWAKIMTTPLDPELFEGVTRRRKVDSKSGIIAHESKAKASASEEQMKVSINQLVLSYLAHHGYAKTARAFQKQCEDTTNAVDVLTIPIASSSLSSPEAVDNDIDMEGFHSQGEGVIDGTRGIEADIELRTRIVNSVIAGDIGTALTETEKNYPTVLEAEEGLMLFKLRCRKFVELLLEAAEMKKMKPETDLVDEAIQSQEAGMWMDVDDDPPSLSGSSSRFVTNGFRNGNPLASFEDHIQETSTSSGRGPARDGVTTQYESALNKALSYGRALSNDYKSDLRLEVQTIFKRTSGLVAWYDPMEAGGVVAELAGQEARITLANELNQAILKSQGRPTRPALETLYRHTAACVVQLGLMGVGAAAFADMSKEFLDA